jgi:hypothetical protein
MGMQVGGFSRADLEAWGPWLVRRTPGSPDMDFGAAVLLGRDREGEGEKMTEPVHGICPYYIFWWEGKTVQ